MPPPSHSKPSRPSASSSSASVTPVTQISPSITETLTDFEALAEAWPVDAFPGRQFEHRAMFSAHDAPAGVIQKLVLLPVEVDAVMRAAIYVAENPLVPANHEDGPGLRLPVFADAEQTEDFALAMEDVILGADCIGDRHGEPSELRGCVIFSLLRSRGSITIQARGTAASGTSVDRTWKQLRKFGSKIP